MIADTQLAAWECALVQTVCPLLTAPLSDQLWVAILVFRDRRVVADLATAFEEVAAATSDQAATAIRSAIDHLTTLIAAGEPAKVTASA